MYRAILPLFHEIKLTGDIRFAYQLKSSAGSIMDNIAEGFGRRSRLEFVQSLGIAAGECAELQSQIYRAVDDKIWQEDEAARLHNLLLALNSKIAKFVRYLNSSGYRGVRFKNRQ